MRRSIFLVNHMMPNLKNAALLAVVAMAGTCHAQEPSLLKPMEKAAVVAAQTSSTTNYMLLRPIANKPVNKPVKRKLASIGLLEPIRSGAPIAATETKTDSVVTTEEAKVVVSPMSFKRGIFDEHEFKVHNTSTQTLRQAKVVLTAPIGSVVQQVSPKPDSVDGLSIMVTIDQIAPGEHKLINVSINYPRNEFAKFKSMVIAERWGQNAYVDTTEQEVSNSLTAVPTGSAETTPPQSTGMPTPKPTQQVGMLKPQVPAMMASATTRKTTDGQSDTTSVIAQPEIEASKPPIEKPTGDSAVMSYFRGPAQVAAGEVNNYQIDIQNLSSEVAEEIIVQLSIPQGMKVTVLDRDAWYDAKNRKITWKVDRIDGRALETIRYKALVKEQGSTEQSIVVGMDDKVQSTTSLKTKAR